jgi:hypothetical protein
MRRMPDPIQLIASLLDRIGDRADVEESAEWYLRSNLIDYKRALLRKTSSGEIDFATGAFMRFCAQTLRANAPLYQSCCEIAEQGAKVAAELEAAGR